MRYKGSLKHKRWRPGGGYGTICPDWTHQAGSQGFSGDTETHPWQKTEAHEMFTATTLAEDGRRYATRNGIAFVAVNSNDGTWHGYRIPWHDVPDRIRLAFVDQGTVTMRHIRRQKIRSGDIKWALSTDDDGRRQR